MKFEFESFSPAKGFLFKISEQIDDEEEEQKVSTDWYHELNAYLQTKSSSLSYDEQSQTYRIFPCDSEDSVVNDEAIQNILVSNSRSSVDDWDEFKSDTQISLRNKTDILSGMPSALSAHFNRMNYLNYADQVSLAQASKKMPRVNYKSLMALNFPEEFSYLQSLPIINAPDYRALFQQTRLKHFGALGKNVIASGVESVITAFKTNDIPTIARQLQQLTLEKLRYYQYADDAGRSPIEWAAINKHQNVLDMIYQKARSTTPSSHHLEWAILLKQQQSILERLIQVQYPLIVKNKYFRDAMLEQSLQEKKSEENSINHNEIEEKLVAGELIEGEVIEDELAGFFQQMKTAAGYGNVEALKLLNLYLPMTSEKATELWVKALKHGRLDCLIYLESLDVFNLHALSAINEWEFNAYMLSDQMNLLEHLCQIGAKAEIDLTPIFASQFEKIADQIFRNDNKMWSLYINKICDLVVTHNDHISNDFNQNKEHYLSLLPMAMSTGSMNKLKQVLSLYKRRNISLSAVNFYECACMGLAGSSLEMTQYVIADLEAQNFDFLQALPEFEGMLLDRLCATLLQANDEESLDFVYKKFSQFVDFAQVLTSSFLFILNKPNIRDNVPSFLFKFCKDHAIDMNQPSVTDKNLSCIETILMVVMNNNLVNIANQLVPYLPADKQDFLNHLFIDIKSVKMLKALLAWGGNPDKALAEGAMPIMLYAQTDRFHLVNYLIESGYNTDANVDADVNIVLSHIQSESKTNLKDLLVKNNPNKQLPNILRNCPLLHFTMLFQRRTNSFDYTRQGLEAAKKVLSKLCNDENIFQKIEGVNPIQMAAALGYFDLLPDVFLPVLINSPRLQEGIQDWVTTIIMSQDNETFKKTYRALSQFEINLFATKAMLAVCQNAVENGYVSSLYSMIYECDRGKFDHQLVFKDFLIHCAATGEHLLFEKTTQALDHESLVTTLRCSSGPALIEYVRDHSYETVTDALPIYHQPAVVELAIASPQVLNDQVTKALIESVKSKGRELINNNQSLTQPLAHYILNNSDEAGFKLSKLWRTPPVLANYQITHAIFHLSEMQQPQKIALYIEMLHKNPHTQSFLNKHSHFNRLLESIKQKVTAESSLASASDNQSSAGSSLNKL